MEDEDTVDQQPLWECIVSLIFTIPIIFFAVVGNIFVIIAIFTHKPLRCVQNFFIISLAVTDLLVGLLMFPVGVLNFSLGLNLGPEFCSVLLICMTTCGSASIFNLCAIAFDRYWAVTHPIKYAQKRTLKRVVAAIALVWSVSLLIGIFAILGWTEMEDMSYYGYCRFPRKVFFVSIASLLLFYIPLFLLSFLYFRIYQNIRKRLNNRSQNSILMMTQLPQRTTRSLPELHSEKRSCNPPPEQQGRSKTIDHETEISVKPKRSSQIPAVVKIRSLTPEASARVSSLQDFNRVSFQDTNRPREHDEFVANVFAEKQRISLTRERRIIRTLVIILGAFFICYAPFFLVYDVVTFCPDCTELGTKAINFIGWLAYINSFLNPLIYTVFNRDFREAFKKILKC